MQRKYTASLQCFFFILKKSLKYEWAGIFPHNHNSSLIIRIPLCFWWETGLWNQFLFNFVCLTEREAESQYYYSPGHALTPACSLSISFSLTLFLWSPKQNPALLSRKHLKSCLSTRCEQTSLNSPPQASQVGFHVQKCISAGTVQATKANSHLEVIHSWRFPLLQLNHEAPPLSGHCSV